MKKIVTIGEILVEMVAAKTNQKFDETGTYFGPYPSGAPAIFADQAAQCGSPVTIVSSVGCDGFGKINLDRLNSHGVDITHIRQLDNETTGSAFVTYKDNGERSFIFNITNSASGCVDESYIVRDLFKDASYLHIMGSSVYSEGVRQAIERAMELIDNTSTRISFDPNVRKEIIKDTRKLSFLQEILKKAHIVMVGDDELEYLLGNSDVDLAVKNILNDYNAEIVIVKHGKNGSTLYTTEEKVSIPPFAITEKDPTGAGDCFGGTFISCINNGISVKKAATYASAAGALAVSKVGPMEGNSTMEIIKSFIEKCK